MALATQCPHCHTTFRVAHDQLKLRAGLVRCGSCKQIFNGIENLLRPEDIEQAASASVPQPSAPVIPSPEPASADSVSAEPAAHPETAHEEKAAEATHDAAASENIDADPLLGMTLIDVTHDEQERTDNETVQPASTADLDALEKTLDDLERQSWHPEPEDVETEAGADAPDQAEAREYEEPGFVKQGRRRQRVQRVMRVLTIIGLPLLLLAFLAQGVYIFRNQLAAWFPQTKPVLAQACDLLGCQLGLPAEIDAVAIESSELQAASADQSTLGLSILLRNHGTTVQAWPSIELTLNDANDQPIARRVFMPRDYLPASQDMNKGFAPKSEQPIKLYFELTQLKASGYRVYLFYP